MAKCGRFYGLKDENINTLHICLKKFDIQVFYKANDITKCILQNAIKMPLIYKCIL